MKLDWRDNVADPRTIMLLAGFALVIAAIILPSIPMTRDGVNVLAVVDITGSMNTRDYNAEGKTVSRLTVAKASLKDLIAALPCSSRVGLALFSERVPFLLFEPVEVCENYGALSGAVDAIDWREAWEGDSHIATAYLRAIDMAKDLKSDLVFITDGQEAPPLPLTGGPIFDGRKGDVKGLIVGAGGYSLSPIPKFDDRGNEIGFWGPDDVPNESRFGLPPPAAESRPGFNARNAPFGAEAPKGDEYLSSVREPYLKSLADETGLAYVHMDGPNGLADVLVPVATPHPSHGFIELRWIPGGIALAALVALFSIFPLWERLRFSRTHRRLHEV